MKIALITGGNGQLGKSYIKKGIYTGHLILKLIQCSLGLRDCDDRDSYLNKRIDSSGALLGALFRQYYTKLIKFNYYNIYLYNLYNFT